MSTPESLPARPLDSGSQRLEFFSDAILAIAITLLVIEIHVPTVPGGELGRALRHLWPSYLAYALSFCTIGLVWLAHHGMFRRIKEVDRPLLLINLVLMLFVAFLPFSTAVLAQYSWNGTLGASISVMLYSLNMIAIGVAFTGLWLYLAYHRHLFVDPVTRRAVLSSARRSAVVPMAYAVTTGLAFVNTTVCYVIWGITTCYIALGPATRRLAVWSSPSPSVTPPTPTTRAPDTPI